MATPIAVLYKRCISSGMEEVSGVRSDSRDCYVVETVEGKGLRYSANQDGKPYSFRVSPSVIEIRHNVNSLVHRKCEAWERQLRGAVQHHGRIK